MSWWRTEDRRPRPGGAATAPYDLIKELCIAVGVITLLAVLLTVLFSSPDDKPSTIGQWSHELPADFMTAASQQLAGTSGTATYGPPYNHNGEGTQAWFLRPQKWLGVSHPINTAEDFVVKPLETVPNDPALQQALAEYKAAPEKQKAEWAEAYAKPLEEYQDGRRRRKAAAEDRDGRHRQGHGDGRGQRCRPGADDDGQPSEPRQERGPRRGSGDQQAVLPDRLHQAAAVHGRRRAAGKTRRSPAPARRAVGPDERDRQLPGTAVAVAVRALVPGGTVQGI